MDGSRSWPGWRSESRALDDRWLCRDRASFPHQWVVTAQSAPTCFAATWSRALPFSIGESISRFRTMLRRRMRSTGPTRSTFRVSLPVAVEILLQVSVHLDVGNGFTPS